MSYNLTRLEDGEVLSLSNKTYNEILQLSQANGWVPDGTTLINDSEESDTSWDCNDYESHNGQIVNEFDAEDISKALKKALETGQVPSEISQDVKDFFEWLSIDNEFKGFEIY